MSEQSSQRVEHDEGWFQNTQGSRKYHHYESIDSSMNASGKVVSNGIGDSNINQFYREIRPGRIPTVKQPGGEMSESTLNNTRLFEEPIQSQKLGIY